jgi:hypothetical protein
MERIKLNVEFQKIGHTFRIFEPANTRDWYMVIDGDSSTQIEGWYDKKLKAFRLKKIISIDGQKANSIGLLPETVKEVEHVIAHNERHTTWVLDQPYRDALKIAIETGKRAPYYYDSYDQYGYTQVISYAYPDGSKKTVKIDSSGVERPYR